MENENYNEETVIDGQFKEVDESKPLTETTEKAEMTAPDESGTAVSGGSESTAVGSSAENVAENEAKKEEKAGLIRKLLEAFRKLIDALHKNSAFSIFQEEVMKDISTLQFETEINQELLGELADKLSKIDKALNINTDNLKKNESAIQDFVTDKTELSTFYNAETGATRYILFDREKLNEALFKCGAGEEVDLRGAMMFIEQDANGMARVVPPYSLEDFMNPMMQLSEAEIENRKLTNMDFTEAMWEQLDSPDHLQKSFHELSETEKEATVHAWIHGAYEQQKEILESVKNELNNVKEAVEQGKSAVFDKSDYENAIKGYEDFFMEKAIAKAEEAEKNNEDREDYNDFFRYAFYNVADENKPTTIMHDLKVADIFNKNEKGEFISSDWKITGIYNQMNEQTQKAEAVVEVAKKENGQVAKAVFTDKDAWDILEAYGVGTISRLPVVKGDDGKNTPLFNEAVSNAYIEQLKAQQRWQEIATYQAAMMAEENYRKQVQQRAEQVKEEAIQYEREQRQRQEEEKTLIEQSHEMQSFITGTTMAFAIQKAKRDILMPNKPASGRADKDIEKLFEKVLTEAKFVDNKLVSSIVVPMEDKTMSIKEGTSRESIINMMNKNYSEGYANLLQKTVEKLEKDSVVKPYNDFGVSQEDKYYADDDRGTIQQFDTKESAKDFKDRKEEDHKTWDREEKEDREDKR